jgi:hypothetical protein
MSDTGRKARWLNVHPTQKDKRFDRIEGNIDRAFDAVDEMVDDFESLAKDAYKDGRIGLFKRYERTWRLMSRVQKDFNNELNDIIRLLPEEEPKSIPIPKDAAMDNERIAGELVRIARNLLAVTEDDVAKDAARKAGGKLKRSGKEYQIDMPAVNRGSGGRGVSGDFVVSYFFRLREYTPGGVPNGQYDILGRRFEVVWSSDKDHEEWITSGVLDMLGWGDSLSDEQRKMFEDEVKRRYAKLNAVSKKNPYSFDDYRPLMQSFEPGRASEIIALDIAHALRKSWKDVEKYVNDQVLGRDFFADVMRWGMSKGMEFRRA